MESGKANYAMNLRQLYLLNTNCGIEIDAAHSRTIPRSPQRGEDIPLLVNTLVDHFTRRMKRRGEDAGS
jgi:hypothetical protein